ncbi:MAG TPA: glucosamine-6-phosphate deaminase [Phycisphaerae bacterium]|nr:glucosamine-6-phosphate deaminase [Phycisphaerae bacterium]
MRVIVVKGKEEMGKRAAKLVADDMRRHAACVLGLATGSTPLPLYKELIRLHKQEGLDFSTVITFNLDEYVGLQPTHHQSYRYFMNENLFDHVNVNPKATHVPDGTITDMGEVEEFCVKYEEMIADVGGIDYQVLGIGGNGHIGFNEPGSSLGSLTRIKTLTTETRKDNARFFKSMDEVPEYAITMGIGTIMNARRVVLLANGEGKADAVKAALEGPVTAMCPASALQLHRFATYVIDEAAASKLTLETCEHG